MQQFIKESYRRFYLLLRFYSTIYEFFADFIVTLYEFHSPYHSAVLVIPIYSKLRLAIPNFVLPRWGEVQLQLKNIEK